MTDAEDGSRFVILLYHGVTRRDPPGIENRSGKHLPADTFEEQIRTLARDRHVLPMSELLERKAEGTLPPGTVAVTFDDGFENNYTEALPILERHDVPATFYLSTGFIGTDRTFWVDKLEYLFNETPSERIRLDTLDAEYPLGSDDDRWQALLDVKAELKRDSSRVEAVVDELEERADVPPDYDSPDYATMDWDQVREMRDTGLCEFGAHTVDHAILADLPPKAQEDQIRGAAETLRRELGERTRRFSYPEGQARHFDDATIRLLKEHGFTSSPTAIFGVNHVSASDFHLHRNMVGFTASFEECLHGERAVRS